MNAQFLLEAKVEKKLREHPNLPKNINAVIAIELSGDGGGRWILDCTVEPAVFRLDAVTAAETTISMDALTFVAMTEGSVNPQMAFLTGKVKVDGNLGIAIKLGELLS